MFVFMLLSTDILLNLMNNVFLSLNYWSQYSCMYISLVVVNDWHSIHILVIYFSSYYAFNLACCCASLTLFFFLSLSLSPISLLNVYLQSIYVMFSHPPFYHTMDKVHSHFYHDLFTFSHHSIPRIYIIVVLCNSILVIDCRSLSLHTVIWIQSSHPHSLTYSLVYVVQGVYYVMVVNTVVCCGLILSH